MAQSMLPTSSTTTPAECKLSASELKKLQQISQWSLKHAIQVFDMMEKKEIALSKNIKEKHETMCGKQFLPGVLINNSSDLRNRLKDELKRLRKIDQEKEWFKTFIKEGYLQTFSLLPGAKMQPEHVVPVEDQNENTINSLNHDRQSALHIATLSGNAKCVEALLRCEQIKVSQRNWKGYTALEVATVKVEQFNRLSKSSSSVYKGDENDRYKMADEDFEMFGVTRFVDEYDFRRIAPVIGMKKVAVLFDGLDAEALHKERQVYVDAANAKLVGAALIASASFGAWLQPPLGYVPYYSSQFLVTDNGASPETYQSYVAIKQHWIIQLFWIFNSLSFFFSLATVIAGADAAVPRQGLILKEAVKSVRSGVKWASWLLSIAILFVVGTFSTIGFAILPPIGKYRINIYITLFIGLLVCGFLLFILFRKLDNRHLKRIDVPICNTEVSFSF